MGLERSQKPRGDQEGEGCAGNRRLGGGLSAFAMLA